MNKPERPPEEIASRIAETQLRLGELVSALAHKKLHAGDDGRGAIASKKDAVIATGKRSVDQKKDEAGSKVTEAKDAVMKKVAGLHVILVDDEGRPISEDGQRLGEDLLRDTG